MEQPNPAAGGSGASQPESHSNPTPSQPAPPLSQQPSQPPPRRPPPVSNPNTIQASTPMVASNTQPQMASPRPHPQAFSRPAWHHPHFSPSVTSSPGSRAASPTSGMAIGVPASSHAPASSSSPFPSSFGQHQISALARPTTDSVTASQGRVGGTQGMGVVGVANAPPSQLRPASIGTSQLSRPAQSSPKPSTSVSTAQAPGSQNFQVHNFVRSPSTGSLPGTSSTSTAAKMNTPVRQPWMNSVPQGKPPLPATYRPQMAPQQVPIRSTITPLQQQQPMSSTLQPQQQLSQAQNLAYSQQGSTLQQSLEYHSQPFSSPKIPQSSSQPQPVRLLGSANQKQISTTPNIPPSAGLNKFSTLEVEEPCSRIISKRTIHELVGQIDQHEKLDPEVEDILVDIAEDFFSSITTFGCSLAKHRKSDKLEAKDILLNLERNWNITLPGFNGDEIKTYRKPNLNEIHKERIAIVKKSAQMSDSVSGKSTANQVTGSGKANQIKSTPTSVFSPNK